MNANDTQSVLENVPVGDLVLAFCLSVLVGLLLGATVLVLLTWASRRRASARITRKSPGTGTPWAQDQLGLYRSTFLGVYRQPSLEPVGPLGSKPGPETSTFRPLAAKSGRPGLDLQDTLLDQAASPGSNQRHSFWLGGTGLKGFLPPQGPAPQGPAPQGPAPQGPAPQGPPPAYHALVHAFQET